MKTWNQLFNRHGWLLLEEEGNQFNCKNETVGNLQFLFECLEKANIPYIFNQNRLILLEKEMEEKEWIECIQFPHRGKGEGLWFRPGEESPKVQELDVYISGVVRQLNLLGFYTKGSCDGHGKRPATVMLTKDCNMEMLIELFGALQMTHFNWREYRNYFHMKLLLSKIELLDLADKLSQVHESWLARGKIL
ncbi:hypothetical protein AA0X95_16840 [Bacillus sp. 1P10SD]|uniref:hypothetical protein n=1 Tax=Bacillus sp. 1P10SD TaxID=3132265 RepID=UPI0039A53F46